VYRFEEAANEIERLLSNFDISQAAKELYRFVWNDFCDWFIELAKPNLSAETEAKFETQKVLFSILEGTLRLIHPFMPFISEEIWQKLKGLGDPKADWGDTLMGALWPQPKERPSNPEIKYEFDVFQEAVSGIRNLRANLNIPPGQKLDAIFRYRTKEAQKALSLFEREIKQLGRLESFELKSEFERTKSFVGHASKEFGVFIRIEGVVDVEKEKARLERKIQECQQYLESIRKKLENAKFIENAPEELVAEQRGKLLDLEALLKTYEEHRSVFQ
jgi:valyl-tRNA synthetase